MIHLVHVTTLLGLVLKLLESPGRRKEIMDFFAKPNDGGATIVQITHSKENSARGNRIVQLRDGWMEKE